MKNILFVCTGNSCRSQIAEGFARSLSNERFNIISAGIYPSGVHPMTIATMKEVGIDISDQTSDLLTKDMIEWCHYFITLCGSARDKCTPVPRGIRHIHWEIENPDVLYASDEDRRIGFALVRDEIKRCVQNLFNKIDKGEL